MHKLNPQAFQRNFEVEKVDTRGGAAEKKRKHFLRGLGVCRMDLRGETLSYGFVGIRASNYFQINRNPKTLTPKNPKPTTLSPSPKES